MAQQQIKITFLVSKFNKTSKIFINAYKFLAASNRKSWSREHFHKSSHLIIIHEPRGQSSPSRQQFTGYTSVIHVTITWTKLVEVQLQKLPSLVKNTIKKIMESIASNIAYFKQDPKGKENKIHDTKQRSGHQQIDAYLLYPETWASPRSLDRSQSHASSSVFLWKSKKWYQRVVKAWINNVKTEIV